MAVDMMLLPSRGSMGAEGFCDVMKFAGSAAMEGFAVGPDAARACGGMVV